MSDSTKGPLESVLRDQGGFTLTDLLVVVGIILVLAAAVAPQVAQLFDHGDQGAVGTLMSDQEMTTVTAGVNAAFITDSFDFDAGAGDQNLANYRRDTNTA